jgi:hypothetical protein
MFATQILAEKMLDVLRRAPDGMAVEAVLREVDCAAPTGVRNRAIVLLKQMDKRRQVVITGRRGGQIPSAVVTLLPR